MKYTVQWLDDAMFALLPLVHASGDAAAILQAVNEINARLSDDPRPGDAVCREDLWMTTIGRLRVFYEIKQADRLVEIVGIRLLQQ
jgi:hypothetical protein